MRRYLVVGNQTLRSARLLRELRARQSDGPSTFHLLVPAANPHVHAFWTEGEAHAVAHERLDEAIAALAEEGIEATGSVGDANPVDAVNDLLLRRRVRRGDRLDPPSRSLAVGSTRTSPAGSSERSRCPCAT